MKVFFERRLALTAGLVLSSVACFALPEGEMAGPGVTWHRETFSTGPLSFNVLKVEIDHPQITLEAVPGQDRLFAGETVRAAVVREENASDETNILGGVNGDFWSSSNRLYSPIGLLVAGGMIHNMHAGNRSAFALSADEDPYIGLVTLEAEVTAGEDSVEIGRINMGFRDDEAVLFTPPYGEEVGPKTGERYILTLEEMEFLPNKPVTARLSAADAGVSTPLTDKTMVLHVAPGTENAGWLADADSVRLDARVPQVDGVAVCVVGGGPRLVSDGEADVEYREEKMSMSFAEERHPRTAVGFTRDGDTIFLVTADGRQPRLSVGVTLKELADYMANLGCWEAMNLDGGGSTTMVVDGKVVNSPSDFKGARPVANSLLVVETVSAAAGAE